MSCHGFVENRKKYKTKVVFLSIENEIDNKLALEKAERDEKEEKNRNKDRALLL